MELEFARESAFIHGQLRTPNRSIDFRSDPGLSYLYSGVRKVGKPWTPALLEILQAVRERTGEAFNACLCNLYPDGTSSMGWHRDDEPDLEPNPLIASVSFGAERHFQFRKLLRPEGEAATSLALPHGSLAVMARGMQSEWEHCIPKRAKVSEPRLNLTFRTMRLPSSRGSFRARI